MARKAKRNALESGYTGADVLYDLALVKVPRGHNCDKTASAQGAQTTYQVQYRYNGLCRVLTPEWRVTKPLHRLSRLPAPPRAGDPVPIVRFNGKPYYELAGQYFPVPLIFRTLRDRNPDLLDYNTLPGFDKLSERHRFVVRSLLSGTPVIDIAAQLDVTSARVSQIAREVCKRGFAFDPDRLNEYRVQCAEALAIGRRVQLEHTFNPSFLRTPGERPSPYRPRIGGVITDEDEALLEALFDLARAQAEARGIRFTCHYTHFLPLPRLCGFSNEPFHWKYNPPAIIRDRADDGYIFGNLKLAGSRIADLFDADGSAIHLPQHLRDAAYGGVPIESL